MWFPFFLFSCDFIPLYSGYFTTQLVLIVLSFSFFFWCVFSFVVYKEIRFRHTKAELRMTKEMMGEGERGEGWEKNHPQSTPWDFWNAPSSLVKGEVWLTHDMTCLEVRRQPANCCAKDLLFMTIHKIFFFVYQSSLLTF